VWGGVRREGGGTTIHEQYRVSPPVLRATVASHGACVHTVYTLLRTPWDINGIPTVYVILLGLYPPWIDCNMNGILDVFVETCGKLWKI
jgi:hypothetical protein